MLRQGRLRVGKFATLQVTAEDPNGLTLDAGGVPLLLQKRWVPEGAEVGDRIEVFIYTNREGQPAATTQKPVCEADQFAFLKVVDVGSQGAFLDWGLEKDLLLPEGTQFKPVRNAGESWVVRVLCDPASGRMVASTKLRNFLSPPPRDLEVGRQVELLFYERRDIGVYAIVDGQYNGLLHCARGEAGPRIGMTQTGYIAGIRRDGKVDLSLTRERSASAARRDATDIVLDALRNAGGMLPVGDKSDPEAIRDAVGLSKKAFKKAIGGLLRARRIQLSDFEISIMIGGGKV